MSHNQKGRTGNHRGDGGSSSEDGEMNYIIQGGGHFPFQNMISLWTIMMNTEEQRYRAVRWMERQRICPAPPHSSLTQKNYRLTLHGTMRASED
jgi:hypothetical protein